MKHYMVIVEHTPDECLRNHGRAGLPHPGIAGAVWFGGSAGEHKGWVIVDADSEQDALEKLPPALRENADNTTCPCRYTAHSVRALHRWRRKGHGVSGTTSKERRRHPAPRLSQEWKLMVDVATEAMIHARLAENHASTRKRSRRPCMDPWLCCADGCAPSASGKRRRLRSGRMRGVEQVDNRLVVTGEPI